MLVTSIFSFSHNVFYPWKKEVNFSVTFILSSANDFSLDQFKIVSFSKELSTRVDNQEQRFLTRFRYTFVTL